MTQVLYLNPAAQLSCFPILAFSSGKRNHDPNWIVFAHQGSIFIELDVQAAPLINL
jgi:hypothetical protein